MNLVNEQWETIKDFPNYMISTESRVLNKTTLNMVSVHPHKHGHRVVRLWKDNTTKLCKIYRLKAIAFIPNPENKREVNHLDGDRTNEDLSNLEWATPKENMRHAIDNGFCGGQFKSGELVKITKDDVMLIRRWYKSGFFDRSKIKKVFNIHPDHASKIAKGRLLAHV